MNVSFDELLSMAFEQRSSKPRLNSMTSGHISSGLDLTYAPSTITMQQPSEGELDILFEAMYDDYIGGQLSATMRTVLPAQEPQAKYALEILHKHGMEKGQSIGTPMATKPKLDADLSGNPLDQTDYRSKIRGWIRGVICKLCSSNMDKDTTLRLWPPLQQNTIILRLSVTHSNLMQPRTTLPYQAYPYSVSLHKGTALPEDRFKYLVRRIGMRCLTPAELKVLAKESA
nr:hypothetical protein [Tanacetum cinerariifolium]